MDSSGIVRGPRLPIEISEDYEPRNAKGMTPWINRTDSLKSKKIQQSADTVIECAVRQIVWGL